MRIFLLTMAETWCKIVSVDKFAIMRTHYISIPTIKHAAFQLPSIQMERPVNCRHDLKTIQRAIHSEQNGWCGAIRLPRYLYEHNDTSVQSQSER